MKINPVFEALSNIDEKHLHEPKHTENGRSKILRIVPRIMLISAALTALFGISLTAGAAATRGFTETVVKATRRSPYTKLNYRAASTEDCPKTIEELYAPSYLPEGIEYEIGTLYTKWRDKESFSVAYNRPFEAMLNDPFCNMYSILFIQYPKDLFSTNQSIDSCTTHQKIKIGGYDGHLFSCEMYNGTKCYIFWENKDYIFTLECRLPVDEALRVAESVQIDESLTKGEYYQ